MIATTISISINVKPRFRFIVYTLRNRFLISFPHYTLPTPGLQPYFPVTTSAKPSPNTRTAFSASSSEFPAAPISTSRLPGVKYSL